MKLNDLASVGGEPLGHQTLTFEVICHSDQEAATRARQSAVVGADPVAPVPEA
ncbi:hypothetical protein LP417_05070 [Polaromonas sp. P1-6]|nr:hypothetical protein LP417_05070 [Polaromonas sp. P1-6]UUZ67496.1 hypothetical protein LP416_22985 [Polaromonas sp. P2-4]